MENSLTTTINYDNLIQDLQAIIIKGQQQAQSAVNKIRLQTYWDMGKRINTDLQALDDQDTTDFFNTVAERLNLDKTLVYRINQFYRTWPKAIPSTDDNNFLSWAHMVELLSLKDPTERNFYLETATKQDWSRTQLRKAIKKDYYTSSQDETTTGLKRDLNPMHYYKAIIENIIDGDTVLARVDLGYNVWVSQRFRFRGINCAEMNDGGEAAKQFVSDKLKDTAFVVIKSYKTDAYGRFVADIFYSPTLTTKEAVAEDGFFLNQEILKSGLAKPIPL